MYTNDQIQFAPLTGAPPSPLLMRALSSLWSCAGQAGGNPAGGLGYQVSASPPYFTPDPEQTVQGSANGIPTTAVSLDSMMQQLLLRNVEAAAGVNTVPDGGPTQAGIQSAYRVTAERYCQTAYGFACAGLDPDAIADKYSALLFQILASIPAPANSSASNMANFFFQQGGQYSPAPAAAYVPPAGVSPATSAALPVASSPAVIPSPVVAGVPAGVVNPTASSAATPNLDALDLASSQQILANPSSSPADIQFANTYLAAYNAKYGTNYGTSPAAPVVTTDDSGSLISGISNGELVAVAAAGVLFLVFAMRGK